MGLRRTCGAGGHPCPIKGLRGVVGEVGVQMWLGHVHETHIIREVLKVASAEPARLPTSKTWEEEIGSMQLEWGGGLVGEQSAGIEGRVRLGVSLQGQWACVDSGVQEGRCSVDCPPSLCFIFLSC